MTDELNVRAWRVTGFQTSRGFAGKVEGELFNDAVGLTLSCEDLASPGYFIMSADEAETIGNALLDTARKSREGA